MKKIILLLVVAFLSFGTTRAQVPDNAIQNFKNKYPEVNNATWKEVDGEYKFSFKDIDSMENHVYFGKDGKFIKSQMELISTQVPASLTAYYKKNYPSETGYKVWEEEDAMGNKSYLVKGKTEMVYFDKTGKYMKKERKKEKEKKDKEKKEPASVSGKN